MKNLIATGIGFAVLVVGMLIGVAIFAMTYNVTGTVLQPQNSSGTPTNQFSLLSSTFSYGGTAITTFVSFLAVLAIAIVGGMAINYLLAYVGGATKE